MKDRPNYENSAENLCNPPEVGGKLTELHSYQEEIKRLEDLLTENAIYQSLMGYQKQVADLTAQIKDLVDAQGSYQNLEAGDYAVKYRRMIKSYHVEPFKIHYEKYISAVIEETINVKTLEGMVKGGVINGDDLKHPDVGVITETPTYAFYIR